MTRHDASPRNLSSVNSLSPASACMAGLAAQEAGDHTQAVAHFERALQLAPSLIDLRLLLAFALGTSGENLRAQQTLDATPELETLPSSDHRRLADAAIQLGATQTALKAIRLLLLQSPDEPELHATLGALLQRVGDMDEAGHVLQRSVLRWPTHVPSLLNNAHWLAACGDFHEALCNYDRALRIAPTHDSARWYRGMLRLMLGDFSGGWHDHEARRSLAVHKVRVPVGVPAWNGKKARGLTLLLWGEQGLGDQIQGVRFAAHLASLGATVIVRCAAPLRQLFESAPGVSASIGDDDALPACDAHVPMLSVPYLLKLHSENSFGSSAYLQATSFLPGTSALARNNRMHLHQPQRVGFVWAGSSGHTNDSRRSLPQAQLAQLLSRTSVQWVSLQLGARSAELKSLQPATTAHVVDVSTTLTDFVDTAHVISALDRIVTIDTSVAHLAGALGVPTLLLAPFVPDWRWQLAREDTPWYASVRLLRQPVAGDWASVIDRVHRELSAGGQARAA